MSVLSLLRAIVLCALSVLLASGPATAQSHWGAEWFPNVTLTTHDGRSVRFYDDMLRNKIVVISFIYTNCDDVCPAETAALLRVAALLGDRVGRDVHFYSISIDPDHDTPEVLARYREQFQIGPGWTFLRASQADVDLIQRKLGVRPAQVGALDQHSTSIVLGNERIGRWIRRSPYDTPLVLANLVTETLQADVKPGGGGLTGGRVSFANAQAFGDMPRGEYLFRTRCASCHTLGLGDRVGPDLAGVASSRPREDLIRWITSPDRVIAEGAPQTRALVQKFRGVKMPNLRLGEVEAAALLEYLASEDLLRAASARAEAAPHAHEHGQHHH